MAFEHYIEEVTEERAKEIGKQIDAAKAQLEAKMNARGPR